MSTKAPEDDDGRGGPSKARRAVLTVIASLALLVAGFAGTNLVIDPDGPDTAEMFFATGVAMVSLAVAGLILVFRDLTSARRLGDQGGSPPPAASQRPTKRPWVEPAVPPIIAPDAERPHGQTEPVSQAREPAEPQIRDAFYDVTVLDGIGVQASKDLGDHGIEDTWDLREVGPKEIAEAADVPIEVARRWRAMAELVAAERLAPEHAALLTRCGIGSLDALARADPATLADRVNRVWADGTLRTPGQRLTVEDVQPWIDAASEHRREPAPLAG